MAQMSDKELAQINAVSPPCQDHAEAKSAAVREYGINPRMGTYLLLAMTWAILMHQTTGPSQL